ncbi:MAG: histidine kinase, partial [Peptococcaceae bacterium]|nr:histidine kinase [Peptococcaceae bacterium]
PLGCGYGQLCRECIVRKAALAARKGKVTQRLRGRLELQPNKDLSVLVSASCFYYKNDLFSVVMIEDISLIVELKGLIPICASCKRIRDDQGYWNRVEKFIEEHTGAEFTHDICPECIKKLYSEEIKVNDN